ncbi:MAG TPA: hypothetical protein VFN67_26825 [Polyangiales bacterium]|nr:hypothetical protein [Polyangiales bacterium]
MRKGRLLASCLILCACTGDPAAHEARDAGTSELNTSAALPPCNWTLDACAEHITWRFDALLDASDVDLDAHFIAIGGQAVGVASGPTRSVVRVHMEDEIKRFGEKFKLFTLPRTVVKLIDVVDGITGAGKPAVVYALACEKPKECSLWRTTADQPNGSPLDEVAGSTFDGDPISLLFDEDQLQPCVLAKGLYCFDGAWHEEIPKSPDNNYLRNVAMGNSTSIAVAAHGVYWKRTSVPTGQPVMPWTRESIAEDVTWTNASDTFRGFFLVGERGAFMQNLPDAKELCSHTSDFAASSGSVLVTKQGEILFGLNEGRCQLQSLDNGPIIDSTTVYCQASQNLLLMTDSSIAGTAFCARL